MPILAIICNQLLPFLATLKSIKIAIFGNLWKQNVAKNGKTVTMSLGLRPYRFVELKISSSPDKTLFRISKIHCSSLAWKIPQAGLHLASSEKNWRYCGGAILEPDMKSMGFYLPAWSVGMSAKSRSRICACYLG